MRVGVIPGRSEGGRRRLRTITVSEKWLALLFTESDEWTTLHCERGLPAGVRLFEVEHHRRTGEVTLTFEHESFSEGDAGVSVSFSTLEPPLKVLCESLDST